VNRVGYLLVTVLTAGTAFARSPSVPSEKKWAVSHQLVVGLPWGSEKRSEAELQADVKEAEATPDQRLVMVLNDLAAWYRAQKKYGDAENIYRRVLKLQVDRMGQHHDIALTHNDLGVLFTEAERFAEAEKEFKEALEIWKAKWDQELRTEDEAVTYHNYGVLLRRMSRSGEAQEMEAKADTIMAARKKAFGLD
jgi:tetratricopeptide (TPR) repeat protein